MRKDLNLECLSGERDLKRRTDIILGFCLRDFNLKAFYDFVGQPVEFAAMFEGVFRREMLFQ